jgi:membrane-associated protease RseP (regulator of RpoE activity)
MNKNVLAIASGLLAALAALAIVLFTREPQAPVSAVGPTDYFDQNAATEDRILALEVAVAEERNARLLLEEELQALYAEFDALTDNTDEREGTPVADTREAREEARRQALARGDRNKGRLVDAGFSEDRASWILDRVERLQMEQIQAIYDARQSGEPLDRSDFRLDPDRALRTQIGDAEYEQYLEAFGRSTSVAVGTVLESSPGQRAGLQSGDQIVGYGGQRVFSYSELSERTMNAAPGQSVVVDIIRDGAPMQIVVEAGPIGISDRRFRGRR